MNDLAITTSSIGAGVAMGGLVGVAAKSASVGAIGAAAGLALGGVASWAVQKDGFDPLKPSVSLPLLIGGGAGLGVGALVASDIGSLSRTRTGALIGAATLAAGLGALAFTNAVTGTA